MKLCKLQVLLLVALIACVPIASPPTFLPPTNTAATPTATTVAPAPSDAPTQAPSSATTPATSTAPTSTDTVAPPSPTPLSPNDIPTTVFVPTASAPRWGQRTKTSGCQAEGALPDPACTPDDIFPNATKDQVCTPGYSSSVRDVPSSEKDAVYAEYGVASHSTGQYEVDHFVSLELGGSNDISNLWPETANPTPGFHQKDLVENYLHDQVCQHGTMTLAEAQQTIASNWVVVYAEMGETGNTAPQPTPAQSNTQAPQATASASSPTAQQPEATASPSGFTLTQLTSTAGRGGNATATIQTAAGAACSIGYVTPSGNPSTAQGLIAETADGNGVCAWSWKIGPSTKPGTGTVTITANGATQRFSIVIQ